MCGLTLVSSPHLARSYHHLFPVPPFAEVGPDELARIQVRAPRAVPTMIIINLYSNNIIVNYIRRCCCARASYSGWSTSRPDSMISPVCCKAFAAVNYKRRCCFACDRRQEDMWRVAAIARAPLSDMPPVILASSACKASVSLIFRQMRTLCSLQR